MKYIILFLGIVFSTFLASAQLTSLPDGGNKKAMVGERVGLTDVVISYNRPGVKGREGKIWGELIPAGFTDQGFGTSKAAPWRAGANENTTIEFSDDVMIEGKPLAAGKYALFISYDPSSSTIIFSKNNSSWGSFFYDEKEDALRVNVKTKKTDSSVEWLKYEFVDQTKNAATVALLWEKMMIPFRIETDYVDQQLASFRRELRSNKGFNWVGWNQAARFTLQNDTDLDEGLIWAEKSVNEPFIGQKNFTTLTTKSQILAKLNRKDEADAAMKEAITMGSIVELHMYGRQLVAQKKSAEALDIFKMNYDRNPNVFTTNVGMMRGYSAKGDYKKALEYGRKALPQAPDPNNKMSVEHMIELLQQNKDVN